MEHPLQPRYRLRLRPGLYRQPGDRQPLLLHALSAQRRRTRGRLRARRLLLLLRKQEFLSVLHRLVRHDAWLPGQAGQRHRCRVRGRRGQGGLPRRSHVQRGLRSQGRRLRAAFRGRTDSLDGLYRRACDARRRLVGVGERGIRVRGDRLPDVGRGLWHRRGRVLPALPKWADPLDERDRSARDEGRHPLPVVAGRPRERRFRVSDL